MYMLLCFRWLDKLGVSSKFGVDVVVRQAFYGGHYSLLDSVTRDPNPVCGKLRKLNTQGFS